MGVKMDDLKRLQANLAENERQMNLLFERLTKELAARLLAKVIKRTPVGDYSKTVTVTAKRDGKKHKKGEVYTKKINPSGKQGGTLRRGWTGGIQMNAKDFAGSLQVSKVGDSYNIDIINPVEYASYVEFGHRTRGGKGWVPGRHMMTISEKEIQKIAPALLEKRIKEALEGAFHGK